MLTSPFALAVALLASAVSASPNFIVMQPDDFQFYEEWTPPAHVAVYKKAGKGEYHFPSSGFPNIEYLRSNGVQMMQANAASPMCGTSRYSTVTGRYASRSSWGRDINIGLDVGEITIPNTKLTDTSSVEDGDDCSANNLAQVMKGAGYKTGMVGKWHLTKYTQRLYSYNTVQENVKECGFDYAEALYAENLNSGVYDGTFSHNMEYVAEHAVDFIKESGSDPFFLYFNPTVPHASGDVYEALTSFTCLDTPEGTLTVEPVVTGMTAEYSDCASYRQSVIDRGEGDTSNEVLGSIWVDDSVGALIAALTETGQLENTFFLFMMDHGQEGKSALYEQGIRHAQFVHFPNEISAGTQFNGLVSTIDIAPTILDYAGVSSTYSMDGASWKGAWEDSSSAEYFENERCLFFEIQHDRAVRCGCHKFLRFSDADSGWTAELADEYGFAKATEILYNLCDGSGNYVTSGSTAPEQTDVSSSDPTTFDAMKALMDCHDAKVKSQSGVSPDYSECESSLSSTTRRKLFGLK